MELIFWLDIIDDGPHSPEAIRLEEAVEELKEEPGSFSPELLHDYEGEEALDPEADKAELVSLFCLPLL